MTKYDRAIMACRATRPEEYSEDLWRLWVRAVSQMNGVVPPDYPGRIFKHCEECGIEVQVGPRQQAAMAEIGEDKVQIVCLVCTAFVVQREAKADPDATFGLADLGNPTPPE